MKIIGWILVWAIGVLVIALGLAAIGVIYKISYVTIPLSSFCGGGWSLLLMNYRSRCERDL